MANINFKGKECITQSQQRSVLGKEFELFCEQLREIGDQNIFCSALGYGCADSDIDENKNREETKTQESTLEGNKEEAQTGSSSKVKIEDGVNDLPVSPRWRKNTPDMTTNKRANSVDDLLVLSRVTAGTQEYVLNEIASLYKADSAAQDKEVTPPKDLSNLGKLIDEGMSIRVKAINAEIKAKQASLAIAESLRGNDPLVPDIMFGREEVNNEIDQLNKDLVEQKEKNAKLKQKLQKAIKRDLEPVNAETIGEGYIYIFLEDSRVEGFEKLKLYREYKSEVDGINNYYEIDISEYDCCDYRTVLEGKKGPEIFLPSCYAQGGNTTALEKVVVLFSSVQLSSDRLAYIEDNKDSLQTKHARTLKVNSLKNNFDIYAAADKEIAMNKADNLKERYEGEGAIQEIWDSMETYPVFSYPEGKIRWNLLLDDPYGVLVHKSVAIMWAQTQLSKICVNIQADNYGRSAILIANFLYNPQMSGLLDVDYGKMDKDFSLVIKENKPDKYFDSMSVSWDLKKEQLKEVERTKETIDLNNLKYNLRSNSRKLLRDLMEEFQREGLNWLDPKDMLIECWRDIFSQGAHEYSRSFNKWFDPVNHLSLDPRTTDSLYDVIVNRPVDKLKITSSEEVRLIDMEGKKLTKHIYSFAGYTISNYEYHLDYYKETVKSYNEKLELQSTEVNYLDDKLNHIASYGKESEKKGADGALGEHIKAKASDSLKYMTRALKPVGSDSDPIRTWVANSLSEITGVDVDKFLNGKRPEVSELLIPGLSDPDKAKGIYDAKKLELSTTIELILGQVEISTIPRNQFEEAVKKYSKKYIKSGAKKIGLETHVKAYDLVDAIVTGGDVGSSGIKLLKDKRIDIGITNFINKVHVRYSTSEFTMSLLSYKPQRAYFKGLIEDSLKARTLLSKKHEGKLIAKELLKKEFGMLEDRVAKEITPNLAESIKSAVDVESIAIGNKRRYYLKEGSNSKLHEEMEKQTNTYLENIASGELITSEELANLKIDSVGVLRYHSLLNIIDTCYGTYTTINELNKELEKLEKKDSLENSIVYLGINKKIFDIQTNCIKVANEINNYYLNKRLRAVPCTELFGSMSKKIKAGLVRKKLLTDMVKVGDVISGTLGVGISTLQLMQSLRSFTESLSQNDEHIIRRDIANIINSGATTLTSVKTIADTLSGEAKKAGTKVAEIAEKTANKHIEKEFGSKAAGNLLETGTKQGLKDGSNVVKKTFGKEFIAEGLEKIIGKRVVFLGVPYLGEILLVIDVATTLWAMWEEAHRDNIYQKWVKLSNLYPD